MRKTRIAAFILVWIPFLIMSYKYKAYVTASVSGYSTAANQTGFYVADFKVYNFDTGLNYSTIQEAINAPETLNGHTIFAEKGMYYEHVVVNKTLSLLEKTVTRLSSTETVRELLRLCREATLC